MSRFRTTAAFLTVLLVLAASSAWALDLGGHDRDGTVIGLTIGHGWNSIDFTRGGTAMDAGTINTFTGGFRLGWASSDYFIVSVGMYGWKKSYYTPLFLSSSASTYNFMLEGFWFPRGEGFWIKGGVGRGTLDLNGVATFPENSVVFNEKGWSLGAGAGYEFRISDGAALGICYDYLYLPLGDVDVLKDISSSSNVLSLNIHFYIQ